MLNEPALIQELQQRIALYEDMRAYKKLYELLYSHLFNFSYSFVKSKEIAEEIVSDVFIKLWAIRAEIQTIKNLKVYLFTINKNFCLNYITRRDKLRVVSLNDLSSENFFNYSTPQEAIISKEVVNKINEAINNLPTQCRIIFHLVKEAELKYREVASVLNISTNTVRNQVVIATKRIADALPLSLQHQLISYRKFSDS